jgi:hypothetical protein
VHTGYVDESCRQAAARPISVVTSISSLNMTTLIGRRWATTPSGGGVQKAGVAGPILLALRAFRRSLRQAGMPAATRQTATDDRFRIRSRGLFIAILRAGRRHHKSPARDNATTHPRWAKAHLPRDTQDPTLKAPSSAPP